MEENRANNSTKPLYVDTWDGDVIPAPSRKDLKTEVSLQEINHNQRQELHLDKERRAKLRGYSNPPSSNVHTIRHPPERVNTSSSSRAYQHSPDSFPAFPSHNSNSNSNSSSNSNSYTTHNNHSEPQPNSPYHSTLPANSTSKSFTEIASGSKLQPQIQSHQPLQSQSQLHSQPQSSPQSPLLSPHQSPPQSPPLVDLTRSNSPLQVNPLALPTPVQPQTITPQAQLPTQPQTQPSYQLLMSPQMRSEAQPSPQPLSSQPRPSLQPLSSQPQPSPQPPQFQILHTPAAVPFRPLLPQSNDQHNTKPNTKDINFTQTNVPSLQYLTTQPMGTPFRPQFKASVTVPTTTLVTHGSPLSHSNNTTASHSAPMFVPLGYRSSSVSSPQQLPPFRPPSLS